MIDSDQEKRQQSMWSKSMTKQHNQPRHHVEPCTDIEIKFVDLPISYVSYKNSVAWTTHLDLPNNDIGN